MQVSCSTLLYCPTQHAAANTAAAASHSRMADCFKVYTNIHKLYGLILSVSTVVVFATGIITQEYSPVLPQTARSSQHSSSGFAQSHRSSQPDSNQGFAPSYQNVDGRGQEADYYPEGGRSYESAGMAGSSSNGYAHPAGEVVRHHSLRLRGHLGMRVSATALTPKLMLMPHNSAQSIVVTADAADHYSLHQTQTQSPRQCSAWTML